MKIQNNSYKIINKQYKHPSFQAMLKRTTILSPKALEKTISIQNLYEQIFENAGSLCGAYYNKFKEGFPDLVPGGKLKGLVIKSGIGCDDKNIQIVHYKSKKSERPLIINVLDKLNNLLAKFIINKQGECSVQMDDSNIKELNINPFANDNVEIYHDLLTKLCSKMKEIEKYSKDFRKICTYSKGKSQIEQNMHTNIENFFRIKESKGIKDEIESFSAQYNNTSGVFKTLSSKIGNKIKTKYFGSLNGRTGLTFANIGEELKEITITPYNRKDSDILFKIFVSDRDTKLENVFFLEKSGRILKLKTPSFDNNLMRPSYMEYISDSDIQNFKLAQMLKELEIKLQDFEEYIKANVTSLSKPIKREPQKRTIATIQQEMQREIEKKEKAKKRKIELEHEKRKKTEREIIEKEGYKQETLLNSYNEKTVLAAAELKKEQFSIKGIVGVLETIFETPVQARSPHLIHDKLSNGSLFGGRVKIIAEDGTLVTVSKVKDPRFMDFWYYSIKTEQNGNTIIMNIDPTCQRILQSKDGKPFVDYQHSVYHIFKRDFLAANSGAENISKYILELAQIKPSENKKVLKSYVKTIPNKKVLQERIESEISEIFKMSPDEDILL
ncbi:hypothetical protein IJD34_07105 [bacterium]|nr:hypothetical protein [bacterium]